MIELYPLTIAILFASAVVFLVLPFVAAFVERRRIMQRMKAEYRAAQIYEPTLRGIALALADHLDVSSILVVEADVPPRVIVHVRLPWWSLFTFGWTHARTRAIVEDVLRQTVPVNALPVIGQISVFDLPRGENGD